MKTCIVCLETKPLDEFYYHNRNGIKTPFSSCKGCHRDAVRYWQKSPAGRAHSRLRDKQRRSTPAYRAKANRKALRWAKRNHYKRNAHDRLHRAVKNGTIIKKSCEICGNPQSEAHHPDYSKPLEVIWLCKPHHRDQHPEYFTRKFLK